jgi:dipeptidyl aminopeptidase/acylaminoacyl peptidase
MRRPFFLLVLFAASIFPTFAAGERRSITEKDLFAFTWIGDSQLSPDGSSVAFVQATVTPDHEKYQTAIYLLDLTKPGAPPQPLTNGPRDTAPRWSPDGKHIAFLRSVEKDGKFGPSQLYLKSLDPAANPIRITDLPKGVSAPSWSPKGSAIAVASLTPQDPETAKLEAERKARATGDDAHVSDVRIVDRAIYRSNDEGYLDPTLVPQLYLVYLPKADGTQASPWQLTGGRFGVEEYAWSEHANRLFYASQHEEEPYYDALEHNSIYGIEVDTGDNHPKGLLATGFTADLKVEAHGLAISHDGKHIAFHAEDRPAPPAHRVSHQQEDLMILDLTWNSNKPSAPAAPRNLTATLSYEMGSGVGGDNTAPRGAGRAAIVWSADDSHLLDVAAKQGSALLVSADAKSGEVTELTQPKQAVLRFAASAGAKTIVALISNPLLIGDKPSSPTPTTRSSASSISPFPRSFRSHPPRIPTTFPARPSTRSSSCRPASTPNRSIRSSSTSTAARTRPTDGSSTTRCSGWRRGDTSSSIPTHGGQLRTARNSPTSSKTITPTTTSTISWIPSTRW